MQNRNKALDEILTSLSLPEIETQVLGEILTYSEDEDIESVIATLNVEVFSVPDNRKLFSAVKQLHTKGEPTDLATLYAELVKVYPQAEAQRLHLLAVGFNAVSSVHLQEHADQLTQFYLRRKTIENHQRAIERLSDLSVSLDEARREEDADNEKLSNDRGARFRELLITEQTEDDFFAPFADKTPEVTTHYTFARSDGKNRETLTLPTGALTFVCAPTSHGKSTFCQNLALDVACTHKGKVLYFTYEECRDDVKLQFLNKYIGTDISKNNISSIRNYSRTRQDEMISRERRTLFHRKKSEFICNLIMTGKLNIIYKNFDCVKLAEAICETDRQLKQRGEFISAVFIDYVQLLWIEDNKKQRREELRDIAQILRTTAIKLQVPIVLAAQLNREALSPLFLFNEYIAEAADLEREANKIICLWNTSFKSRATGDKNAKDIEQWQASHNVTLSETEQPHIFAILTKNRGSIRGLEAMWIYHGNSGKITDDCASLSDTPPQEQSLFAQSDREDPEPF